MVQHHGASLEAQPILDHEHWITHAQAQGISRRFTSSMAPEGYALHLRVFVIEWNPGPEPFLPWLDPEELKEIAVARMQGYKGSLALSAHQHLLLHQFVHRTAQGADAHAQLAGYEGLAGQLVSRRPCPRFDARQQCALDLQVERTSPLPQSFQAFRCCIRHAAERIHDSYTQSSHLNDLIDDKNHCTQSQCCSIAQEQ
jgi:hypothetical protein